MKSIDLTALILFIILPLSCAEVLTFEYLGQFGETGVAHSDNSGMDLPTGIAIDSNGYVYVAEYNNHRLVKLDPNLDYVTQFGITGTPKSDTTGLNGPFGVTIDNNDNIYVTESLNHRIVKLNPSLTIIAQYGTTGLTQEDTSGFKRPYGVAIDSTGNVYVADSQNARIMKFDPDLQFITTYDRTTPEVAGIAFDGGGNFIISETHLHQIVKLDPSFSEVTSFGVQGVSKMDNDGVYSPKIIATGPNGNVYVADYQNHRLLKLDSDLDYVSQFGVTGAVKQDHTGFKSPIAVAVDDDGNVYIADHNNHRVVKLRQVVTPVQGSCPDGMAYIDVCSGYCIDRYEAYNNGGVAGSAPGQTPWTDVDHAAAKAACEGAGKRLCSTAEWMAACNLGGDRYELTDEETSEDHSCNTARECGDNPCKTGASLGCRSNVSVYDMVGNAMEWTADTITSLDQCGSGGLVSAQYGAASSKYGEDSFWNQEPGCKVGSPFLVGGTHYDAQNAGCFALGVHKDPTWHNAGYGFRCCSGTPNLGLKSGSFWETECVAPSPAVLLALSFDDTLDGAGGETPTTSTGIEYADGVSGKGVLVGTDDHLTYPSTGNFDVAQGTIELWMKPTELNENNYLFNIGWSEPDHGRHWCKIGLYADGQKIEWLIKDKVAKATYGALTSHSFNVGTWYHIVMTWNPGDIARLFINGALIGESDKGFEDKLFSVPKGWNSAEETQNIEIGYYDSVPGTPSRPRMQAHSVIDELRILNYQLSLEDIQARYTDMKPIPTPSSTITITPIAGEWPMRGHDLKHTGVTTGGPGSDLELAWVFETGDEVYSSPTVQGGTVYVGSVDKKVYAIDVATGNEKWSFETGGGVYSTPTVVDGTVYIGSRDSRFYALDAATGNEKWNFYANGWVQACPAVANGRVIFGSLDKKVYAIDAKTGDQLWTFETGDRARSAAVVDGVVFIGSDDKSMYALDAATGVKKWSFPTGNGVPSYPAVKDGVVFFGSADQNVYAVDADTGQKVWDFATGGIPYSSPAVVDDLVVIGSTDKKVYALNAATGSEVWSYETGARVDSSPAVADGTVYVGSYDKSVYALDLDTGDKRWSYETGDEIDSSPAVAGGLVYIGSDDGKVYAFRNKAAATATPTASATATATPTSTPTDVPTGTQTPSPPPSSTGTPAPTATGQPTASATAGPTGQATATPTASGTPDPSGQPTPTNGTATPSPTGDATPAPSATPGTNASIPTQPTPTIVDVSPSPTGQPGPSPDVTHLLDNGQSCTTDDECQSGNCRGGVCCITGMACCDADADCRPNHHCDMTRSYCVPDKGASTDHPPSQEEMKESAKGRIAQLRKQLLELKKRAPDADLSNVESLIAQADEKLTSGDVSEAYRLSVEADTTYSDTKKELKLAIGAVCFESVECETANCQNKICCKAGEICCDKDANCDEDERCDTDRSYCVSLGYEKEGMTIQERIIEVLTDPLQLITIVAAIVVGLGLGIYQLKGRIEEKKTEERYEHMAETVEQMQQAQYYQGPGGKWEQQPQQWDPPKGGWGPQQ